ncbi:MAG: glycosyltransferase family 2 protein [Limimaricola soesokkakensis]|uniref:glycosyltransferase family 2 protein n=1 Tax=Limimaricola soesokkakensis TaxID=1343159 RepID=UPI0040591BBF
MTLFADTMPDDANDGLRIAVVICSVGRPEALAQLLPWLTRQTKRASEILCVVTKPGDLPDEAILAAAQPAAQVLISEKGLPRQRNRGLDAVLDRCDVVFFIDDDYLPARDALIGIERAFMAFPDISGLTGALLADGIHGAGVDLVSAAAMIEADEAERIGRDATPCALERDLVGLYGCNMAYRAARIGALRFDERLPLYGWQEDVDFASRVPGEMIRTDALRGVHCGVKSGRDTNGHLLGYSQVANVAYLMRKGSIPAGFGLRLIARNMLANHLKMLRPEPWVDRRARASGNWMALGDLLHGRAAPERILDFAGRPR